MPDHCAWQMDDVTLRFVTIIAHILKTKDKILAISEAEDFVCQDELS